MNLGQFRDQVRLQLGNMPEDHPLMEYLDQWINSAIRDFPQRELPGEFDRRTLFSELTRHTLVQPSINQAWVQAPSFMLAPLLMRCSWSNSEPDLDLVQWHPVNHVEFDQYQLLNKAGARWTSLYSRFDDKIYLWPTPTIQYQGWLDFHYLFEQPNLGLPEHEPLINKRWHRAITFLATAYGEAAQNHKERAAYFEGEANKQAVLALNWIGRHEQRTPTTVEIYGDPTSSEIYD